MVAAVTTARRFSAPLEVAGAVALVLLLTRPLVFGGSDRGVDFYTHYWFVWHQSEALRDGGPSLYVHNVMGVFTPLYAFYGATLYVLTGALALLLGSPLHAYVFTFLVAFAASYGGWWWLARQAGLRGPVAHAPGLVGVTSAYAMTVLYVRGDWPEHVAVAMLPLVAASGISVLRADRVRPGPALTLAASVLVLTGSHNLTLLCGSLVLIATGAALLLGVPEARRMVTRAGVLRVLAIAVPAALVNAWFLLPDLVYGTDTNIHALRPEWHQFLREYRHYVDLKHLFTLSRDTVEPGVPHYAFALPILALGWTLAAVVVARPGRRDPWLRVLAVLAVIGAALLFVMTHVGLLRGPFELLQYSYRLESYINVMISGGVLAGLVLLMRAPRRRAAPRAVGALHAALAVIAVVSVIGAVRQSDTHRDPSTYAEWHSFPSYYTRGNVEGQVPGIWDYTQGDAPYLQDPKQLPYVAFDPKAIDHGRAQATLPTSSGQYVLTNIATIWALVRLSGGTFAGISTGGRAVVQPDPGATTLTVMARRPPAVVIGRLLSFVGLLGLAAGAAFLVVDARRRRRRRPPEAEVEVPALGAPTAV